MNTIAILLLAVTAFFTLGVATVIMLIGVAGRADGITKNDLTEMEKRMAIKVSELEAKVGSLDAKVTKIWTEQQTKYDALVVLYDEVKAALANAEVPPEAETALTAFEMKLQAFDDTIPDPA